MIICKLSEILGRKKLKISDVIRDTGITRPTLTSLYYGKSTGITLETLNTLCKYLSVSVNDLLVFYNFDVEKVDISFPNITQGTEANSNRTIVETANFNGCIKFEQKHLNDLVFKGDVSFHDYNPAKHESNYELSIDFYETTRDIFFSVYPDDVQDDIISRISKLVEILLGEHDCELEITSTLINYK